MSLPVPLPVLVGPPELLAGRPREAWLDRVRLCRRRLLEAYRQEQAPGEQEGVAIDQALGLLLMVHFVRDRNSTALSLPPTTSTTQGVCRAIRQAAASPLLQSVLDPMDFASVALPESVWRAGLASDLGWRAHAGRVIPLPVTAFGEFYQVCLSERDAGAAGERRAAGVHYTPVSLADYLTSRTLDGLAGCRAETPVRILDPSCGGGTFLLAALRWLLRQHGLSPQAMLDLMGTSLFGTDVDPQAVLWTRRALLLAAWDVLVSAKESGDAGLRVPDLSKNVVCRDFLVWRGVPADDLPGTFDAILGGPPFVRIHELLRIDPGRVERYRAEYRTARSGQLDLYMPFFEEAVRRLADGGWLGWCVSSTFLRTSSGQSLRALLGRHCTVHELVEFEDSKVYPDAVTQIVLVVLEKGRRELPCRYVRVAGKGNLPDKLAFLWSGNGSHPDITVRLLPSSGLRGGDWSLASERERALLARLRKAGPPLGGLPVAICQGVVTGADSVFLLRRVGSTVDGESLVQRRGRGRYLLLESALLRPVVRNSDIAGYGRLAPKTVCIVPCDARGRLIPEEILRTRHPKTHGYLLAHRDALAGRRGIGLGGWYTLRSASGLMQPSSPRLLLKLVSSGGDSTLDAEGRYPGQGGVLMLVPDPRSVDPFYLLGVLNSRVFWFFVRQTMPTMGHGRHILRRKTLRHFPVVLADREPQAEARRQVADAERRLLAGGDGQAERLLVQVEQMVAELYGIDPAELVPQ